ncbi:MAG: ribonucleoside-diphosphate reductase, adenosylcobalamin-dependent [Nevskia sp.]|nr:ribonucleoside-diphosphate reductase, adenosylcobalamin-dependent [Nevskia sp.]
MDTPAGLVQGQFDFYAEKLREKYCKNGERSAEEVFRRVARGLAAVENEPSRARWEQAFFEAMQAGFYPAGRIASACGTELDATLINCFVQPVGDALSADEIPGKPGIFQALAEAAETMRRGGGVGYDFSRLRPRGAQVRTTHSRASGPISFMRVFDRMCETVESAGTRRGAQMGILRVDHPDIRDFVVAKDIRRQARRLRQAGFEGAELEEVLQKLRTLSNFNISVAVTDAFMKAVEQGTGFALTHAAEPDPAEHPEARRGDGGQWIYRTIDARELWDLIMRTTYETADPGIVFIDQMNRDNNLYYAETIEATNPCVTGDTWVHTSRGPRRVAQLLGAAFEARVNGADAPSGTQGFFRTGRKPVLKLRTAEGYSVRLTADHPVRVASRVTRWSSETTWLPAGELRPGDTVLLHDHRSAAAWPGAGSYEDGYILGHLYGDGHLKADIGVLTVWPPARAAGAELQAGAADAVMARLHAYCMRLPHRADFAGWFAVAGGSQYRLKMRAIFDLAQSFGLVHGSKAISAAIESASSDFCRGFLSGLFDTDGSVQGSQAKGVSVRLAQSDLPTLEAVQRMLLRLGIASVIYPGRRPAGVRRLPDGRGGTRTYQCKEDHELVVARGNLERFASLVGFADTDKAMRLAGSLAAYRRAFNRERFHATVLSVMPDGEEDVYDVQVPGRHHFDGNGLDLHNCGEQPLPDYGCCCLGSVNLAMFVEAPFTAQARFDYARLRAVVATAVRMLDNVLEVTYWPLPQQKREAQAKRRIGLGFTGLASAMAMLRLRYGSAEATAFAAQVAQELRDHAYQASSALAQERGAFALFDADKYLAAGFARRLPEAIKQQIARHGIRNSHLLSIAPTGTISLAFGQNVSSGIEPPFAWSYQRRAKDREGNARAYEVQDWGYRTYVGAGGDPEHLPDYFVNAQTLLALDHLRIQAAVQPYVDSSISKTVNCPADYPFDQFKDLYLQAWKLGLKGCTTYRPNDVTGSVLSVAPAEVPGRGLDQSDPDRRVRLAAVPQPALASLRWPGRPDTPGGNPAVTYMVGDGATRFAVFIGHFTDATHHPFEVWVNGAEQPRGLGATAKLLSMDMRSNDHGWLLKKLDSLIKTGGLPITVAMPPRGEKVVFGSATAALAALVKYRCQELGAFDQIGATPVLDALMSDKEPRTGAEGTMSWTVDVRNYATADDFVLTLKELQMPDGSRRPYSLWLAGDYPRDFDGLCRMLSLDMRVLDPAWIGEKLRKLLSYAEPVGGFMAQIPGEAKQQTYPSTVAYMAALVLHRYRMLGLLDAEGRPVKPMGILEARAAEPPGRGASHRVFGKQCPDCGAHAVVRSGGCDNCTNCGWVGACG